MNAAVLEEANLSGANLSGTNLSGANLNRANLLGANLDGAILTGANFYGAIVDPGNVSLIVEIYKNSLSSLKFDVAPAGPFRYGYDEDNYDYGIDFYALDAVRKK